MGEVYIIYALATAVVVLFSQGALTYASFAFALILLAAMRIALFLRDLDT